MVSKHFRYIYLLVVFNFFFLLERKERSERKKKFLSLLSPLFTSTFFSLQTFFSLIPPRSAASCRNEKKRGSLAKGIKEKRGEIDNDARDVMNPIIREQRWSKRTWQSFFHTNIAFLFFVHRRFIDKGCRDSRINQSRLIPSEKRS